MSAALVTGAGVRVGRAIALALAAAGHDVVCHAHRSLDEVQATAAAVRALGKSAWVVSGDLTDEGALGDVAVAVGAFAPVLDVLVHSAAAFEAVPFAAVTRAQFRHMQALNVEAPYFLTQKLLPALSRAADPVVVHILDAAWERPMKGYSHYHTAKAGLAILTRALATELGGTLRVVGVAPGAVAFPDAWSAEERARVLARVPAQREGEAEDVGAAVVSLVQNRYVSGQILAVDGARSAVY